MTEQIATDRAGMSVTPAETAPATVVAGPLVNRRRRGVVGGAVLIAVGVTYLLPTLGIPNATSYLFLALGAAFAAAYLTGYSPYVYLVPAATLISFGTGLLIPGWLSLPAETVAPVFLASLTVGLVGVFVIRPNRRWPLIPAAVFGLITLLEVFRIATVVPQELQPLFVPAILIGVGAYLILAPRL